MISVIIIESDWHLARMLKELIADHPVSNFIGVAQTGAE